MSERLAKIVKEQYDDLIFCANDRLDYSLVGHTTRLVELLDEFAPSAEYRYSMFRNVFIALCNSDKKFVYTMQLFNVIRMVHRELAVYPDRTRELFAEYSKVLRGPNVLFIINADWKRDDIKNIQNRGAYLGYLALLKEDRDMALYMLEKYATIDMYSVMYELAVKFNLWNELRATMDRLEFPVCEQAALADTVAVVYSHGDITHPDWQKCTALLAQIKKWGYHVELLVPRDVNRFAANVVGIQVVNYTQYIHNLNALAKLRYATVLHLDCGYISHLCCYMQMGIRDVQLQPITDMLAYADACPCLKFDYDWSTEAWQAPPVADAPVVKVTRALKKKYILAVSDGIPEVYNTGAYIVIRWIHRSCAREYMLNPDKHHVVGNLITLRDMLVKVDAVFCDEPSMSLLVDCASAGKPLLYNKLPAETQHLVSECGLDDIVCGHFPTELLPARDLGELRKSIVKFGVAAMGTCSKLLGQIGLHDRSPKLADAVHEPDMSDEE